MCFPFLEEEEVVELREVVEEFVMLMAMDGLAMDLEEVDGVEERGFEGVEERGFEGVEEEEEKEVGLVGE